MAKKNRGCLTALIIFFVLVFVLVAGAYAIFDHYMDKSNYEEIDPNASIEINTDNIIEEETVTGTNSPDHIIDDILQDLEQNVGGMVTEGSSEETDVGDAATQAPTQPPIQDVAGVEQILLIGSDKRANQGWHGNSDSMILLTINHNTNKIIMTSLMRDSYVYIPGVGNDKLNRAYALGGAALLLSTIRQNYKINVTKYAVVDFSAFTSVINVLGTIPMTLNNEEISHMGAQLNGLHHEGNLYYLNGDAALAYARIRKVGRYDFERTERQRRVLTAIVDKMKVMDLGQINAMANAVLPYVTHNITNGEVLSYLAQSPNILRYQMIQNRLPYDGMYTGVVINNQQVLALDWGRSLAELNRVLYQ